MMFYIFVVANNTKVIFSTKDWFSCQRIFHGFLFIVVVVTVYCIFSVRSVNGYVVFNVKPGLVLFPGWRKASV